MKRLQTVFSIQASLRGRTVSRSSTSHLGGGTAGTDAVGTIPSTDELSRVDYCGNMVYDRGERRMLLENGYVTFDLQTNTPSYHFYLRDHLGNNRVVMAQNGTVEQVTHYYPFGGLMRESTNPGLQPYKYGGKELDRTSGLDAYDFGARMYFADRMQWGQMDPLCEKYYDWSPYGYCKNRPFNLIDPNGKDEWDIDQQGHVLSKRKTSDSDSFYKVEDDGHKYLILSLQKGTILQYRQSTTNGDGDTILTYDVFKIRGDENGAALFKAMSAHTGVEWSLAKTGIVGKKGLDFLTSSHVTDAEFGMKDLINNQLKNGYKLREIDHNHPRNTLYPSGVDTGNKGDILVAKQITDIFGSSVILKIYIPVTDEFIEYNSNSNFSDFE